MLRCNLDKSMRIICDHLKAATFIIGDDKGIAPSNTDQGYVVRRLMRRAIRYGRSLGIKQETWIASLAEQVITDYENVYPELKRNKQFILDNFNKEEAKFNRTLEKGILEFNKLASHDLSGQDVFNLYQSYGFPLEITEELAKEKGIKIDKAGFAAELKKHQDLSRTAAAGKFKGGLADASEETIKLHTAAHLLLAALKKVLGEQVVQRGSNITPERLRFDFLYSTKMTLAEIKQVEDLVNSAIEAKLPITCEEMTLEDAKKRGAAGTFESKYGERVKVYTASRCKMNGAPDLDKAFSQEICGGPHVENTGLLGKFKIIKEES